MRTLAPPPVASSTMRTRRRGARPTRLFLGCGGGGGGGGSGGVGSGSCGGSGSGSGASLHARACV